ncbi:MAG TPA: hypothetical protein DIV86_05585, partial [Alphaproteobacteria bacterium]|nr:hypothetical protein [Alphaproteobacteria bacterium]
NLNISRYISSKVSCNFIYLSQMVVDSSFQKLGVATALKEHFFEYMRAEKYDMAFSDITGLNIMIAPKFAVANFIPAIVNCEYGSEYRIFYLVNKRIKPWFEDMKNAISAISASNFLATLNRL